MVPNDREENPCEGRLMFGGGGSRPGSGRKTTIGGKEEK